MKNFTDLLERYPINGTFELTARCNLKCKMCLIRIDRDRMEELGGRERTANEWIQLARQVHEAGTIGLLLTGGEPMLRPDFITIYKEVAKMGFLLTLYTNATLVTPEIMKVLKEYPPHMIGITIYGASPETYENVTGNANAYERMLEGVEQLRKLPSKLILRTTLIKDNIKDLDKISRWACSFGKNVDFNVSRIVTKPVRGGISDVESCRLTPEQNVAMLKERNMDFIVKPFHRYLKEHPEIKMNQRMISQNTYRKDKNFLSDTPFVNRKSEELGDKKNEHSTNKPTLYGCDAGINSYTITWDGKLIGCQLLGDCWTYPLETGFLKAWDEFPEHVFMPPLPAKCMECNVTCNACPATRLAETGLLNGHPAYICKEGILAKEMEEELIDNIKEKIERKKENYYETL